MHLSNVLYHSLTYDVDDTLQVRR